MDLSVENLLVDLATGLPFSEALRKDENSGASVGNKHVVRNVLVLEMNTSICYGFREIFHAVAELKNEPSHWELRKLGHFHASFLSAVWHSHCGCSLDGKRSCQVVCLNRIVYSVYCPNIT